MADNPILEALQTFEETKKFKSDEVPKEALQGILKSIAWIHSAGGLENFSAIVVREDETKKRLDRTKRQAREARNIRLNKAKKTAEKIIQTKKQLANQEANVMLIKEKGRIEEEIKKDIRSEIEKFVKGKKKINKISYAGLKKEVLDKAKKKKIKLKEKRHADGVVLSSDEWTVDLRVGAIMEKLGAINMEIKK